MYSNSHINKAAFSFLKTNQNNNIKTQKRNYQKSLLQNIPLKQKELLKIKKQGNVENMSFFLTKQDWGAGSLSSESQDEEAAAQGVDWQ